MTQSRAPKPSGGSTRSVGPYELICELSRGFFAPLWAAHDASGQADPKTVMVRRIRAPRPRSPVVDKLNEAAHWAERGVDRRLPSVVQVIRDGDQLDVLYAFVDGEPLRHLLRNAAFKRQVIPLEAALRIAVDILIQVDAVHHRAQHDSKLHAFAYGGLQPDSIWVGTDGVARLLDIAIAPVAANTEPWSHDPLRSAYMAPEQLKRTAELSPQTDVFSMAVILWEMISNRRLFPGSSDASIREKVAKQAVARLDDRRATGGVTAPAAVADVVAHALAREPGDRHGSAGTLASALRAAHPLAEHRAVGALLESLADSSLEKRRTSLSKAGAATVPGFLLELTDPDPIADVMPRVTAAAPSPSQRDKVSVRPPPVAVRSSNVPPLAPSKRPVPPAARPSAPPPRAAVPPRTSAQPAPPAPSARGRTSALPPKPPPPVGALNPKPTVSVSGPSDPARRSAATPPPRTASTAASPARSGRVSSAPPPAQRTSSAPPPRQDRTSSVPPAGRTSSIPPRADRTSSVPPAGRTSSMPPRPAEQKPSSAPPPERASPAPPPERASSAPPPPAAADAGASAVPPTVSATVDAPPPSPAPATEPQPSPSPAAEAAPAAMSEASTPSPASAAPAELSTASATPASPATASDIGEEIDFARPRAARFGGRRVLFAGVAALVGAVIIALVLASGSGDDAEPPRAEQQTTPVTAQKSKPAAAPTAERREEARAPQPPAESPPKTVEPPAPAAAPPSKAVATSVEADSEETPSPSEGKTPSGASPLGTPAARASEKPLHRPAQSRGSVPDESYEPGGI